MMPSIYNDAIAAGYDEIKHLDNKKNRPHTQQVGLVRQDQENEDPIVGLRYRCDYKAEEEWGVNDLRKAFNAGADPNSSLYQHENTEPDFVPGPSQAQLLHVTDTQWALMVKPVAAMPLSGEKILHQQLAKQRAMHIPGAPDLWQVERMTVPQLKKLCRARGSRVKANSKKAVWVAEYMRLSTPANNLVMPGWFQRGTHLVLPRGDGAFRFVSDRLIEAAQRGTLSVGNTSVTFGSSLALFDFDDMSESRLQQIREQHAWVTKQMALLEPVKEKLHAAGHRWFFLGDPNQPENKDAAESQVRYWLNSEAYRLPNHGYYQPVGWYTLEELEQEKFFTDMMAAHDISPDQRDQIKIPGR